MRRYGLREADRIEGLVRRGQGGRNEVFQILKVNREDPELAAQRPEYETLKAIYPDKMFKLEMGPEPIANRVIDLMAPLGMGQRALIVAPPKAGKTILLTQIAKGLAHNHPDVPVVALLVGERPEEVTEIERSLHGVVFSSTFDEDPRSHIRVAEIGIEYAKRQVELGQNVVVLLDSITRLARAYNLAIVSSDRTLSGGIDSAALFPPKKFFGAARNVENGGSLTTIGTALVETGSRMDDVIFEEFKGTGNMELRLSRELADRRVFPAIDVLRSGTRREEMLLDAETLRASVAMRRALERSGPQAMESFLKKLGEAQSNADFVRAVLRAGLG
jgi:transcription termination factor Rho